MAHPISNSRRRARGVKEPALPVRRVAAAIDAPPDQQDASRRRQSLALQARPRAPLLERPPDAFGLPSHIGNMSLEKRKLASSTLLYASTNFFAHFFDLFGLEGSFQEWMRAYYESQAVASALNHAAIVHRARMSHDAQELNRPFTWKEKVTAIQGLNKMLSTELDRHKTGVVLLVMSTLALSDVDPDQGNISYTGPPLAFEALMMPPKEIRIVGQSGFPAAHLKATATLVQRIGGLQTLKLSGLPELIAYGDLLDSSIHVTKPNYSSYWKPDYLVLAPAMWDWSSPKHNSTCGSGFFKHMVDLLPAKCIACMTRLAKLGRTLDSLRTSPPENLSLPRLIGTSFALHHQLLSLAPWTDLDQNDQRGPEVLYDICKLAALIYCNAVNLAAPPDSSWHIDLADRLHSMTNDYYSDNEPGVEMEFLIWAVCVGALAVARGPTRDRYEVFLRHLLKKHGVVRQTRLEELLMQFLWSEHACRHGLAMLWLSLA